jgi:hypothetical protein
VSELNTNGGFVTAADIVYGPGMNYGHAIAVDTTSPGSPSLYTTGGFRNMANFNPNGTSDLTVTGPSGVNQDIFVSRLTPPASPLRATRSGTSLATTASSDQALASLLGPGNVTASAGTPRDAG